MVGKPLGYEEKWEPVAKYCPKLDNLMSEVLLAVHVMRKTFAMLSCTIGDMVDRAALDDVCKEKLREKLSLLTVKLPEMPNLEVDDDAPLR